MNKFLVKTGESISNMFSSQKPANNATIIFKKKEEQPKKKPKITKSHSSNDDCGSNSDSSDDSGGEENDEENKAAMLLFYGKLQKKQQKLQSWSKDWMKKYTTVTTTTEGSSLKDDHTQIPKYIMENHLHLSKIILSVVRVIEFMFEDLMHSQEKKKIVTDHSVHLELEVEFGKIVNTSTKKGYKFQPGVSKDFFIQSLQSVHQFDGWTRVDNWCEYIDYFYEQPSDIQVRTTVSSELKPSSSSTPSSSHSSAAMSFFTPPKKSIDSSSNSSSSQKSYEFVKEHISKTLIVQRDYRFEKSSIYHHDLSSTAQNSSSHQSSFSYDMRLSLSMEDHIPEKYLSKIVGPTFVRIKQRKTFYLNMWKIDFTMSWSGPSKSEAEQSQRKMEPVYEMECELIPPSHPSEKLDSFYLSTDLLLKMLDFLDHKERSFYYIPQNH